MNPPPPVQSLLPSLELSASGYSTLKTHELEELLAAYLSSVAVDEAWYLSQYPDIKKAQEAGTLGMTPADHYRRRGYLEGRLPSLPDVDEKAYRARYPDVAKDIAAGAWPNALTHFINSGYQEARDPCPEIQEVAPAPEPPKSPASRTGTFRRSGL